MVAAQFPDVHFIEEGLCGRTICSTDPIDYGRNGMAMLPALLATHDPLDVIVIMLGTNDSKAMYGHSPFTISDADVYKRQGLQRMKELMQELRDKPLTQIGTHKIDYTRDYMPGTRTCMADGKSEPMELKGQNVMYYELEGGTTFITVSYTHIARRKHEGYPR